MSRSIRVIQAPAVQFGGGSDRRQFTDLHAFGGSIGLSFAIPASVVRNVVEQIQETGVVERGWLVSAFRMSIATLQILSVWIGQEGR